MKKQILAAFGAMLLMPLLGLAQMEPTVKAKIPFKFVVEGRTLPAGNYEFQLVGNELGTIRVTDLKTDHSILVPIMAPVGLQPAKTAEILFDKTGKTSYLSEVVIPGMDGYRVAIPTVKHETKAVPAAN